MQPWRAIVGIISLVVVILTPFQAQGLVLEWNAASWSDGSTATHYFELDSSNPGPDVSISIAGSTGSFVLVTPNDTTALTGGQGTGQESLRLAVDFPDKSSTVTITVNFHYAQGVTDVDFLLFDIDQGDDDYRDLLTDIYAQYNGGAAKAPTITPSANNTSTGSGTNQNIRGNNSAGDTTSDGNATIDYGTNIINSFTFTYGNHSSAPSNPGDQWIGLYDINFAPRPRLPEAGTSIGAAIFCGVAIFLKRRRLIGSKRS